jgi:hypothetical protein
MIRKISYVLAIALFLATPILSQEKEGLTTKVYDIKHKDASAIAQLLMTLDVGSSPGSISMNPVFNTVTIRANEQGHAAAADLIRKYDVPAKTIEFQFYLIKGSATGEALKEGLPVKVQGALHELASVMQYKFKGFELIDAPYIRTQEGTLSMANLTGKGIYNYKITLSRIMVKSQIQIGDFQIYFSVPSISTDGKLSSKNVAELATPFSIAEGEIVVLGASQIDREGKEPGAAIITIVTARILK